jgi:hypothetical protein
MFWENASGVGGSESKIVQRKNQPRQWSQIAWRDYQQLAFSGSHPSKCLLNIKLFILHAVGQAIWKVGMSLLVKGVS